MVKIRMARIGRKGRPVFTVVAIDSKKARNGLFLERLGQYNPNARDVLTAINVEGIKKYLAQGAELSETLKTLFKKNNITL